MKGLTMNPTSSLLKWLVLFIFIIGMWGCSTDHTPFQPAEPELSGKIVQSTEGPIRILAIDEKLRALQKGASGDTVIYNEEFITASAGGSIQVGDSVYGITKIDFAPNDLPYDTTITLEWMPLLLLEGEFGPHGTVFNSPVRAELSYKAADLGGTNEEDLQVYYYNETTQLWENMGGVVDTVNKVVVVYLDHFSTYAVGGV